MKEIHITTEDGFFFKIIKEKDDPMTNRLSIGGSKDDGCYIVFRGEIKDCHEVLEQALEALKEANDIYLIQQN